MLILKRLGMVLRAGFFPARCAGCRDFLPWSLESVGIRGPAAAPDHAHAVLAHQNFCTVTQFEGLFAPWVCSECLKAYLPVTSPCCPVCGIMFQSRVGNDHVCGACIKHPPRFTRSRAGGVYRGVYMVLIHNFKYKGHLQLAAPLGMLLLSLFLEYWRDQAVDMVVPVPLHLRRLRQRGFNQAFLLVRNWPRWERRLKLRQPLPRIHFQALQRRRHTRPQTSLHRRQRRENIKNAFVVGNTDVEGKHILLVDDVHTTGATLNECALVLRRAGARQVDVLTLARA